MARSKYVFVGSKVSQWYVNGETQVFFFFSNLVVFLYWIRVTIMDFICKENISSKICLGGELWNFSFLVSLERTTSKWEAKHFVWASRVWVISGWLVILFYLASILLELLWILLRRILQTCTSSFAKKT